MIGGMPIQEDSPELKEIIGLVRDEPHTASGESQTRESAIAWDARFKPHEVRAWFRAGCYDAGNAGLLTERGVTPEACRNHDLKTGSRIAYDFVNGDVTLETLVSELAPGKKGTP